MSFISSQGTSLQWGTTSLVLSSLTVNSSAEASDITSMSSRTVDDPENTGKKFVVKDYDAGITADTEISVDFVGSTSLNSVNVVGLLGLSRNLSIQFPADETGTPGGFSVSGKAVLTQFSLTGSVGDFARGNATFRLSGL